MAKITVSLDQLRRLMLAEVRKQQGCDEVVGVEICRLSDTEAKSNWSGSVISLAAPHPMLPVAPLRLQSLPCSGHTTCSRCHPIRRGRKRQRRNEKGALALPLLRRL